MKRIIFDVPKWHVFQHRSSRGIKYAEQEDGPRLRFEDELFDRLYSGDPVDRTSSRSKRYIGAPGKSLLKKWTEAWNHPSS